MNLQEVNKNKDKETQLDNIKKIQVFQWLTSELTLEYLNKIKEMRTHCLVQAEIMATDGTNDFSKINALLIRGYVYKQLIDEHEKLLIEVK